MRKIIMVFLAGGMVCLAHAQNNGVSDAAGQYVNMFTGDFGYSIPLLVVPGPNGESVPVTMTYSAGIGTDQMASWVGLGWNLGMGEITRKVNGVPDDWKGVTLQESSNGGSFADKLQVWGPLYFDEFTAATNNDIANGTPKTMDIYQSNYKIYQTNGSPFLYPDYDQFTVTGPGIGGQMEPHIFKYGNILGVDVANSIDFKSTGYGLDYDKVTFRMKDDNTRILAPYYHDANATAHLDNNMYDAVNDNSGNIIPILKTPGSLISTPYTSNCPSNNQTLWSEYYIQYCTHYEIGGNLSGLHSQGFLNLPSANSNATDGIAAFKITTPEGMTYHYTLPVYNYGDTLTTFDLSTSYGVGTNSTKYKRDAYYAVSWKLTAITGPDYEDTDNNHQVGQGDKGYWVAFDYGLWMSDFVSEYPYTDYAYDMTTSKLKKNIRDDYYSEAIYNQYQYSGKGTIVRGKSELYYLNTIRTATHTAYFVKDVKKDDYDLNYNGSSHDKRPTLRLSAVVLMRNSDIAPSGGVFSSNQSLTNLSGFNLSSNYTNKNNIIHQATYNYYQGELYQKALQIVELEHDYSLCPKYVRNVNCTLSGTAVKTNGVAYTAFGSVSTSTAESLSGKLTLNTVKFYQEGHAHLYNDYKLTYGDGTSTKNPYYHPLKKDFWGMYKSDFDASYRGNYTTPGTSGSHVNTDAWSLTQIETPLKGKIKIEYESDRYGWVGDHISMVSTGVRRPTRLFMIKSLSFTNNALSGLDATFFDKDVKASLENSSTVSGKRFAFRFNGTNCSTSPNAFYDCEAGTHLNGHLYYNESPTLGTISASTYTCAVSGTSNLTLGCSSYSSCNWSGLALVNANSFSSNGYLLVEDTNTYGGGIRVKTITINDPYTNTNYKMKYSYEQGVATSEPTRFGREHDRGVLGQNLWGVDRHVPSPGVGYTYVTATAEGNAGSSGNPNGKVRYQFSNYQVNRTGYAQYFAYGHCGSSYYTYGDVYQVIRVTEVNNQLGLVKKKEVFDVKNNLVYLEENDYTMMSSDGNPGFNTGRVDEVFYSWYYLPEADVDFDGDENVNTCDRFGMYVSGAYIKSELNLALAKTRTTVDGITVTTLYQERDALTGVPVRMATEDPTYGLRTTLRDMAWDDYSGMGPKSVSSSNANILTPVYTERTFRGASSQGQLLSAGKTEFSNFSSGNKYLRYNASTGMYEPGTNPNSYNLWGTLKTSAWASAINTDGTFSITDIHNSSYSSNWKLLEETTLRNVKNQVVESRTLDKRYTAVKMGYGNKFPIAEIADANYFSFTYSGFETKYSPSSGVTHFDAEVLNASIRDTVSVTAHTGVAVAKVTADVLVYKAPICTTGNSGVLIEPYGGASPTQRTFRVSVWLHTSNASNSGVNFKVNGTNNYVYKNDAGAITVGNWVRLVKDVSISTADNGGNLEIYLLKGDGSASYFDDFRFHPLDAPMVSYVYNDRTGRVTHQLDADNYYTRFEYDAAGRPTHTYVETPPGVSYSGGEKRISSNIYHIAQ